MGYIEYAGFHRVHSIYILRYTQGKKTLKYMKIKLDKPHSLLFTVYMLRVMDGWSQVKFLKRGGEVRVSLIMISPMGEAERVLESF